MLGKSIRHTWLTMAMVNPKEIIKYAYDIINIKDLTFVLMSYLIC